MSRGIHAIGMGQMLKNLANSFPCRNYASINLRYGALVLSSWNNLTGIYVQTTPKKRTETRIKEYTSCEVKELTVRKEAISKSNSLTQHAIVIVTFSVENRKIDLISTFVRT